MPRNIHLSAGRFRWTLLGAAVIAAVGISPIQAQEQPAQPGPLRLQECINLGMTYQPALKAAQASLNAAQNGYHAVNNLPLGSGLLAPDLKIRRQQACLGITIASAGLQQAEWETRYAVTRNYYSMQYARAQLEVAQRLVERIKEARDHAEKLVKIGDKTIKVTRLDVDVLEINLEIVKRKEAEARFGEKRAMAALREAIGVDLDFPLQVAENDLPPLVKNLDKKALIDQALALRGEMAQAATVLRVTELEVNAQSRLLFKPQAKTFAAGADIHAKPIPQGVANGEYRPGAIGPEMPVYLIGRRNDRMQRARDFTDRAEAVVEKTTNLITLEVEATYLKWQEASENMESLVKARDLSQKFMGNVQKGFNEGKTTAEEYLRARALADSSQAQYNEGLYLHALALAAMERVTAGGYRLPVAGKD